MKKIETINLIDGDFTSEEAEEILLNMLLTKIQFHKLKNFSSQERFGKEDPTAIKRIPALNEELKKLSLIMLDAKSKHKKLSIRSEIQISFIDP